MSTEQHGRRFHPWVAALAVLLVLAGLGVVGFVVHAQQHAPQPPASAAVPLSSAPTPTATKSGGRKARSTPSPKSSITGPILSKSAPVSLSVPAIGVSSSLVKLGLKADHTVQVPPLSRDSKAGWYTGSPTPGQLGPSVILGHIDSAAYGPAVFFKLGALRQGNMISVSRTDHKVAVFRVDRVVSYAKNSFPTLQVYGNTNNAQLRLITCGGKFDFSTHNYLSNIVVYASLVSSHQA